MPGAKSPLSSHFSIASDRLFVGGSANTRLFPSLGGGRLERLLFLHRPALWNDPRPLSRDVITSTSRPWPRSRRQSTAYCCFERTGKKPARLGGKLLQRLRPFRWRFWPFFFGAITNVRPCQASGSSCETTKLIPAPLKRLSRRFRRLQSDTRHNLQPEDKRASATHGHREIFMLATLSTLRVFNVRQQVSLR